MASESAPSPNDEQGPHEGIMYAACTGDLAALMVAMAEGADLNGCWATGGWTPLMVAAAMGHTPVVAALIAAGARVDAADDEGTSAVFAAAGGGHADTLTVLAAAGADVTWARADGDTALHAAARCGAVAAARALLALGARRDAANRDGHVPADVVRLGGGGSGRAMREISTSPPTLPCRYPSVCPRSRMTRWRS